MTTLIENAVTYVPAVPLHLKKEPTRFFFLRKILNKFLLRIPYNTDKNFFCHDFKRSKKLLCK